MLELLDRGFCKWFCTQVQELDMNGQRVITMPFRPRDDEQIVIYIEEHDGKFRAHDDGETLGGIFIDSGMTSDVLSGMQQDYLQHLASLNKIKQDGLVFYVEDVAREKLYQKVLNLVQFIAQVSNIDALHEPPKEIAFAKRVYERIKTKVSGYFRQNFIFDFGSKRHPGDQSTRTRKIDFFKENGNYILGRALYSKTNFDKVLTTWNIIEEIEKGRIPSSTFKPREKTINKATICHESFDDDAYIEILEKKGKVFFFPKEQNAIIDFFNS
ncbi:MAG: DUF1828 domain-containing protein [Candidatus Sigynarchaeota archaeon]